ncbi:MAG: PIN domain-containing protein [Saprospiraceae bacterium]|nr:PIN domain-containing protein [Saprospiraceae bacterium]
MNSTSAKSFIDTNIIIYSHTNSFPEKQLIAQDLLNFLPYPIISIQVLNEFISAYRKKFKAEWSDIQTAIVEIIKNYEIHSIIIRTIAKACSISERYGFSYYDSLIITAALETDCTTLYSEDLQDGQVIEGKLQIVNPFKN